MPPGSIPTTRQPLLAAIQRKPKPALSNYPALAVAATSKAELDTDGADFASLAACLETLNRLGLSVSESWLLMILLKRGPMSCSELVYRMKIHAVPLHALLQNLQDLGVVAIQNTGPLSVIGTVAPTQAARNVMASVLALSGLATAATQVLKLKSNRR